MSFAYIAATPTAATPDAATPLATHDSAAPFGPKNCVKEVIPPTVSEIAPTDIFINSAVASNGSVSREVTENRFLTPLSIFTSMLFATSNLSPDSSYALLIASESNATPVNDRYTAFNLEFSVCL